MSGSRSFDAGASSVFGVSTPFPLCPDSRPQQAPVFHQLPSSEAKTPNLSVSKAGVSIAGYGLRGKSVAGKSIAASVAGGSDRSGHSLGLPWVSELHLPVAMT